MKSSSLRTPRLFSWVVPMLLAALVFIAPRITVDATCSLEDAIEAANSNAASGGFTISGNDTTRIFLDAATAPRMLTSIAWTIRDGFTCVSLNRPGTLVLVQSLPPAYSAQGTSAAIQTLQNCMVTTTAILNFRDGPGGNVLDEIIPYGVTLTALRRTTDWFEVDYMGAQGWISADYVTSQGRCD